MKTLIAQSAAPIDENAEPAWIYDCDGLRRPNPAFASAKAYRAAGCLIEWLISAAVVGAITVVILCSIPAFRSSVFIPTAPAWVQIACAGMVQHGSFHTQQACLASAHAAGAF